MKRSTHCILGGTKPQKDECLKDAVFQLSHVAQFESSPTETAHFLRDLVICVASETIREASPSQPGILLRKMLMIMLGAPVVKPAT